MVKSDMGLAIISSSDMASAYIGESSWSPLDKGVWYIDSGVYGYTINSSYYYFYLGSPSNPSNGTRIQLQGNQSGSSAAYQAWRLDRIDTIYEGVTIYNAPSVLKKNQSQSLTCAVYTSAPHDNSQYVEWTSDNTSVATVNSSGKVTAVSPVTVTITARSTYDSGWSASKMLYIVPLEDGVYYFKNVATGKYITPNTGAPINISSHLEQWSLELEKDQAWALEYIGTGYYLIQNIIDETFITSPVSTYSEEKITAESRMVGSEEERQQWKFNLQSDGSYQIIAQNRYSFVMSSNSESTINGGNIVQRSSNDGDITKWYVRPWKDVHSDAYIVCGLASPNVNILMTPETAANSTWRPIIENSAEAWNNSGAGVNVSILDSGSSSHVIHVGPTAAPWNGIFIPYEDTGNITGSNIIINTVKTTPQAGQCTVVHEMGHMFWLSDNPSFTSKTIMSYSINPEQIKVPQFYDIYNVFCQYN